MKKPIFLLACVTALVMAFFAGCEFEPQTSGIESSSQQSASEEISDSSMPDSSFIEEDSSENDSENSSETEHVHGYEAVVTAPTCLSAGYTTYICSECGDSYVSDRVSALEHDYEAVVTAPTCLSAGFTTYTCSECGDSYVSDRVSALGHSYESVVTEPTYESEGFTTYTCATCGDSYVSDKVAALKHNYKSVVTVPTCTEAGYTTYTCSDCGDSYTADTVSALGHSYKSVVTAATCESAGFTTNTCLNCNHSYVSNEVAALGHSYKSVVTAPTYESEGFTTYTCSTCGDSYVSDKVAALKHNYKSVVTVPTCTEAGYTTYTCSDCGDSYTADTVAALGHNYKSVVTSQTCTTAGYATYTCSTCGDSYIGDEVAATGHSYESVVTAPTCIEAGYTTYTCSDCGYSYNGNAVAALGHDWIAATTSAPKTCSECGATEGEKLPSSDSGSTTTLETLYVNYINVGQGDSIFIKVGDCDILIDAGTSSYGTTVKNYLSSKGVDDIELMINTHLDSDHYGGLSSVLSAYKVEEFWRSNYSKTGTGITTLQNAVASEGLSWTPVSVGTIFTHGYLTLSVLYNGTGASSSNDSSLVVMLQYGDFRFLFTGDISSTIESKLVSNSNIDLSCDVLKVPHHGSAGSSSSSFLNATGAKYGVICVGSNSYGHPTSDALSRLSSAGITTYRTDNNGNVVFSTNGSTLTLPGGSSVSGGSGSGSSSGGSSSGSGSSSSGSSSNSDTFIGNKESKVFHLPTCSNLPAVSKRNYLYNYWFIVNCIGYRPCQICLKNYTP